MASKKFSMAQLAVLAVAVHFTQQHDRLREIDVRVQTIRALVARGMLEPYGDEPTAYHITKAGLVALLDQVRQLAERTPERPSIAEYQKELERELDVILFDEYIEEWWHSHPEEHISEVEADPIDDEPEDTSIDKPDDRSFNPDDIPF
jgi:hypothetical protein